VIGRIGEGTTEQFRESSEVYDQRYFKVDSKVTTLRQAFGLFPGLAVEGFEDILDIGCGSGNATFALLELAPNSSVHATDISPDMVSLLASRAEKWALADRIVAFVSDAEKVKLNPGTFDLIVGSSMVHHLNDPDTFIDRVLEAIKPGGLCVLLEPMKAGHLILRHFITAIASLDELSAGIPENIRSFFKTYTFTIDAMCAADRTAIDYSQLDDKWMFSRVFFEEAAERNAAQFRFFATDPAPRRFAANIEQLVSVGLGIEWSLPEPARSFVKSFDDSLPADAVDELASTACIVFRKSGSGFNQLG